MPARSGRHGRSNPSSNNSPRSTTQAIQQHHREQWRNPLLASPAPSPPTQLPTPLPEEGAHSPPRRSTGVEEVEEGIGGLGLGLGVGHLIDFDDHDQSLGQEVVAREDRSLEKEVEEEVAEEDELEDMEATYRSPPFREAQLPSEEEEESRGPNHSASASHSAGSASSELPLPIPPPSPSPHRYGALNLPVGDAQQASSPRQRQLDVPVSPQFVPASGAPGYPSSPGSPIRFAHQPSSASSVSSGYEGQQGEGYGYGAGQSQGYGAAQGQATQAQSQGQGQAPTQSQPHSPAPSYAAGHTRSPTLPRSSTTLESLSRTLRTYVPSSIHIPIPTAAPSPPLVSRPVSFGWFSGQGQPVQSHRLPRAQSHERSYSESAGASSPSRYQEPSAHGGGYGGGGAYQEYDQSPRSYTHGYSHSHGKGLPYPVPVGRQQGWEEERQHQHPYGASGAGVGIHGYDPGAGSGLAQAMRRVGSPRGVDPGGGGEANGGVGGGGRGRESDGIASYPRGDAVPGQADPISWARWDSLDDRRLLLLAYPAGLQIWDCADLRSITEVLNLDFSLPEWDLLGGGAGVRVLDAAVLPAPRSRGAASDPMAAERPLLGIIMESDEDEPESTLFLYSLRRHHLVKRLPMPGLAERFLSNEHFIVISTTTPPALHILSPISFHTLSIISSVSLLPYTTPTSSSTTQQHTSSPSISTHPDINNNNISVSLGPGLLLDSPSCSPSRAQHRQASLHRPHPVFALNGRLLAYASSRSLPPGDDTRRTSFSSASSGPSASSLSSSPFGFTSLPKTQAELGTVALKVGGSVLGGMKFLGGMAYEAAKSRVAPDVADGLINARKVQPVGGGLAPGLTNRFFSRSAPAAAGSGDDGGGRPYSGDGGGGQKRERRYSNTSVGVAWDSSHSLGQVHPSTVAPHTTPAPDAGYFITVVDLAPLWSGKDTPVTIADILASGTQPIAELRFSEDGCGILVVPREGKTVKMYLIRPTPGVLRKGEGVEAGGAEGVSEVAGARASDSRSRRDNAWQLYNLRRGRTSAVVEGIDWTGDGRWVAVGTRKRTVHVFAVNPFGGQPDHRSHLEGKVWNPKELQPLATEVGPLLRLRVVKQPGPDQLKVPLAFTFICPTDTSYPSNLLPTATSSPPIDPTSSPPLSPYRFHRPTNFQDVLMFDPTDGMLYLRRFTLEERPKDQGISASMSALGATSISLPGMGGAGRLSSSPSSNAGNRTSLNRVSKLTQMMETPMELTAKESIVATWNVQRQRDWGEIKRSLQQLNRDQLRTVSYQTGNVDSDWLAEAELSTFSRSKRILPRSLYVVHQFSFYTLGEDYHALIRKYQLDVSGNKIDVRRQVEVSAHFAGVGGESFVEGFSDPRDSRMVSSSFDEPLASAISGGIDYQNPAAIIPMYPNGTPGSKPKSFRNSIPIRTMAGIGDGMTESLGRIRRKVRSPNLLPRSDSGISGPVPLEFDEEDEDFVLTHDALDVPGRSHDDDESTSHTTSRSRVSGESEASISTSSTVAHALEDDLVGAGDDMWRGWESQDRKAIEDAERFDDISAVGFLDEEHTSMMKAAAEKRTKRSGRR